MKHTYPKSFPPDHPMWAVRLSWAIMDDLPPGAIPEHYRFLLGGLVAGAMSELYKMGQESKDPAKHPTLVGKGR